MKADAKAAFKKSLMRLDAYLTGTSDMAQPQQTARKQASTFVDLDPFMMGEPYRLSDDYSCIWWNHNENCLELASGSSGSVKSVWYDQADSVVIEFRADVEKTFRAALAEHFQTEA
jgi:hypothetical protein